MSAATPPPAPSAEPPHAARVRLNLYWLLVLRWAAAAGQVLTIGFVYLVLRIPVPLPPLVLILAIELATNAALHWRFRRKVAPGDWSNQAPQAERLIGLVMLLDVLLLSGLLYWTGGSANPFAVFYLVNLTLAAVLLAPRSVWRLNALALAFYIALFFIDVPLPGVPQVTRPLSLNLVGQFAAFGGAAVFIAYFVTRLTRELGRLETEVSDTHRRQAESSKIEALGTLAAGAAHELATPLSTIAVVARELELDLSRRALEAHVVEDVQLVRREVDRCRGILNLMRAHAGENAGEELERLSLGELADEVLAGLADQQRIDLDLDDAVAEREIFATPHALMQSLRAVVQNALDASPPGAMVKYAHQISDGHVTIVIQDSGQGMPVDVLRRAGDPFFTTKEPGQGMGLGLFLATKVIQRLEGSLKLDSQPGRGTTARIELPLVRK